MDERFPNIYLRAGSSGILTPCIQGTGLRVQTLVIAHHVHGETVEFLAEDYDLPVAVVQEALAYYEAHRAEIDTLIRLDDAFFQHYEEHGETDVPPELRDILEQSREQYWSGRTYTHEEFWAQVEQINEALDGLQAEDEYGPLDIPPSLLKKLPMDEWDNGPENDDGGLEDQAGE